MGNEIDYYINNIVPELVGLTIVGALKSESEEEWGFVAEGIVDGEKVTKMVFVLMDPEGNGPGFLEVMTS